MKTHPPSLLPWTAVWHPGAWCSRAQSVPRKRTQTQWAEAPDGSVRKTQWQAGGPLTLWWPLYLSLLGRFTDNRWTPYAEHRKLGKGPGAQDHPGSLVPPLRHKKMVLPGTQTPSGSVCPLQLVYLLAFLSCPCLSWHLLTHCKGHLDLHFLPFCPPVCHLTWP